MKKSSMSEPKTLPLKTLFLLLLIFALPHFTNQLDLSQYEAMVRIKQQLNFPQEVTTWSDNEDFCNNSEPSQILTLDCYEDNITQLHVTGNYVFPHLSQDFSVVSLFTNIAALTSLKVLSLVSLGLKGNLPSEIGDLSALEILNLTSNELDGPIPREVMSMTNLQTLILDHNMFSGNVPEWIGSLLGLTVLSLKNNSFTGAFPKEISTMVNLRTLVLSGNNLSGAVPGFHNLTNLQVLDLGDNNLGPKFPNLPRKLVSLVFRGNNFHSTLSDELNSCYLLQRLDISLNEIVGQFPPSILSLNSLTYLDIGGNKLTGKMLQNMSCTAPLTFVNLTGNRLTGDLPDCLDSKKDKIVLYEGNCLSERYKHQHPLPFCHNEALAVGISPHKQHEKRSSYGKAVVASSVVGGIAAATALVGLAFVFRRKEYVKKSQHLDKAPHTRLIVDKVSPAYTLQLLKDARYISETTKLGALGIPPYRTFVLDELKEATGNFNASNLIGEGSHGQVYKGCLTDGTIVAIRCLKVKKRHGIHSYTPQLELIAKLRHCHLVSALGHCFECHQDDSIVTRIFLVFEYVPSGTLRTFVSDGQPAGKKLTWTQRLAAGIGVARGIQFLHTGIVPGVYSNCVKITDILIDHDLHIKISKYNLPLLTESRRLDETDALFYGLKDQCGTILSCPEKNDIYDFGVILLEIIVGRTITSCNDINISRDILSVSLTADAVARKSIVDPAVHKECSDNSLKTLIELCIRCLSYVPSDRPSIEDVLWNLQFAAQVQDTSSWDGHLDSPAHVSRMELLAL